MKKSKQNNQPLISIVIPVYNVKMYLNQCLDSISKQTYKNYEVICIDDGSTDGSLDILYECSKRDLRVQVYTQPNQGAAATRNKGIDLAQGEYIIFLDSDDYFEEHLLEKLYDTAIRYDADIVTCGCLGYNDTTSEIYPMNWVTKKYLLPRGKKVFNYHDCEQYIFQIFTGWAWDKLYRTDFLKQHGLLFQLIRTSNDVSFVYKSLVCAKKIVTIDDELIYHRSNIQTSLENTRNQSVMCFYEAIMCVKEFIEQKEKNEELLQSYYNWALDFSLWNLRTMEGTAYTELYDLLKKDLFHTMGIVKVKKQQFYDRQNYKLYQKMMKQPRYNMNQENIQSTVFHKLTRFQMNYTLKYVQYRIRK